MTAERKSPAVSLSGISSKALGHRITTKLKQFVGANSDVWAALDELIRRAEKGDRG